MALKRLPPIEEKFPVVRKSRLGAAPPADDVLNNVGEPEPPSRPASAPSEAAPPAGDSVDSQDATDPAPRSSTTKRRERAAKRTGQGGTRDSSIYGRRYRKTGRSFQFGARTTLQFAERMRETAEARNMTMGELLDEMRDIYDNIHAIAEDRQISANEVLTGLKQQK